MLSRCVVTYGDHGKRGGDTYISLCRRQAHSLTSDDGSHKIFEPKHKLPSHSKNPYAFKAHAIEYTRIQGYDLVLWCDAPIVRIKPLRDLWEYIEENGYVFFDNEGYNNGQWATDRMLDYFGYDREEANNMKHIMACCFGLNFNHKVARQFQDAYFAASNMIWQGEPLYKESWQESRHDQTAASFLIHILDMDIIKGHESFFTYDNQEHRGAYGPIKDSVCLVSK